MESLFGLSNSQTIFIFTRDIVLQLSKRTWNIELSDMHGVERSIQLLGNRLKGFDVSLEMSYFKQLNMRCERLLFRSQPESTVRDYIRIL